MTNLHTLEQLTPHQNINVLKLLESLKEKPISVLSASAGSGKSFALHCITNHLKDNYSDIVIVLTAPTHKAVSLLQNPLAIVKTIHSALGLVLTRKGGSQYLDIKAKGHTGDILMVDEASMLQADILSCILKAIEQDKFKRVILSGDRYQLAPVTNNQKSNNNFIPAFDSGFPKFEFTEIVRQKKDSNILKLGELIKSCYGKKSFILTDSIQNKLGFKTYTFDTAINSYVKQLKKDLSFGDMNKFISYTNNRVDIINHTIRKKLYGDNVEEYIAGETIIIQQPYTISIPKTDYKEIIFNTGEELIIESVTKTNYNFNKLPTSLLTNVNTKLEIYRLKVQGLSSFINVVSRKSIDDYKAIESLLKDLAKTSKEKNESSKWKDYWEFVDKFHSFKYSFASTIYKIQGSTLTSVIFDLVDFPEWNQDLNNRSFYVGITRPTDYLYFMR